MDGTLIAMLGTLLAVTFFLAWGAWPTKDSEPKNFSSDDVEI